MDLKVDDECVVSVEVFTVVDGEVTFPVVVGETVEFTSLLTVIVTDADADFEGIPLSLTTTENMYSSKMGCFIRDIAPELVFIVYVSVKFVPSISKLISSLSMSYAVSFKIFIFVTVPLDTVAE